MKKLLGIVILAFLLSGNSYAGKKDVGKGELIFQDWLVDYFYDYIKGKGFKHPGTFVVAIDGSYAIYWYCSDGSNCRSGNEALYNKQCEDGANVECKIFARQREIKWLNGINPGKGKPSRISSKVDKNQLKVRLTELGFYGDVTSSTTTTTPKISKKSTKVEKKKDTKKVVNKYKLKGERSIALNWEGYEELIAGTVKFDETDYKGTLNLPLPNNDGICDGTYSLQEGGKGTWQIACTNNMGAAGTLKWNKNDGVTGSGRDHNDKKVKFTVSKKS